MVKRFQAGVALLSVLPLLLFRPVAIQAQSVQIPLAISEKRPSPRSPSAAHSNIPPFLRKGLESQSTVQALDPTGASSMESFAAAQAEKEAEKKRLEGNLLEKDMETIPDDHARVILEQNLQYQFGKEKFPMEWQKPEEYEETAGERFYVTFFLALPFALAFSYGTFTGVKKLSGAPKTFDGPQTFGLGLMTLLLAGGVAWYDLERWKEMEEMEHDSTETGFSEPLPSEAAGYSVQGKLATYPSLQRGNLESPTDSLFQFGVHYRF